MSTNKNSHELKEAAKANTKLMCITDGCTAKRNGSFSRYCSTCRKRRRETGTVQVDAQRKGNGYKRYRPELLEVRDILNNNPNDKAIQAAITFIETWMYQAVHLPDGTDPADEFNVRVPARVFVRRLSDYQMEPALILAHVCAGFCYARDRENMFDGCTALSKWIGNVMLLSEPLHRSDNLRLSKTEVTEAGVYLWDNLLPILVRVQESRNAKKIAAGALRETLSSAELTIDQKLSYRQKQWLRTNKQLVLKALENQTSTKPDSPTGQGE